MKDVKRVYIATFTAEGYDKDAFAGEEGWTYKRGLWVKDFAGTHWDLMQWVADGNDGFNSEEMLAVLALEVGDSLTFERGRGGEYEIKRLQ